MDETIARRVTPLETREAAERLVGGTGEVARKAAERFIQNAPTFGIDLNLIFATFWQADGPGGVPGRAPARQVCLAVPGGGRTAMLFMSGPGDPTALGAADAQRGERAMAVAAALDGLREEGRFVLAQALPEPHETWAIETVREAGLTHAGDLAYLKRQREGLPTPPLGGKSGEAWPEGVRVASLDEFGEDEGRAELERALDRSYAQTLDCPELCGMRDTGDVIDSHRATGVYDPAHWRVIYKNGAPEGCCLMSVCPEHGSAELVYIGISPELRGSGVARRVLVESMHAIAAVEGVEEITCAVDRRNTPALKLYAALGFSEFTSRVAYVAPVRGG